MATVGSTLSIVGVVFLFIPGPGLPLIVLGVAILATEFAWAEVVFARLKKETEKFTVQAKRVMKRKRK
ncbi:MAG: PGPGW domain-containing protein [Actinomycetota bacterium]|nr:PGPGW domain-containing protein [Actinomycetota bacterium]